MISTLLVDDEPIILEGLKNLIDWNDLGYRIDAVASDGYRALKQIEKDNPQLVILDIKMPKLHGTDVIKKSRENGYTGEFIILTSYEEFQYAKVAIDYGVVDYITKPVDEDELIASLSKVKQRLITKQNTPQLVLNDNLKKQAPALKFSVQSKEASEFYLKLVCSIESSKEQELSDLLTELEKNLCSIDEDSNFIRYYLIELFVSCMKHIANKHKGKNISEPSVMFLIDIISRKNSLHEILEYFKSEFITVMEIITPADSKNNTLDSILYYIETNLSEDLTLKRISKIFGYNSSYLGKVFRTYTNMSFNNYVDNIKMLEAQKLLKNPELKIYEIALSLGYSNVDYFHKKFKKHVGLPPDKYRKEVSKHETLL